jgi:hypothetical protein
LAPPLYTGHSSQTLLRAHTHAYFGASAVCRLVRATGPLSDAAASACFGLVCPPPPPPCVQGGWLRQRLHVLLVCAQTLTCPITRGCEQQEHTGCRRLAVHGAFWVERSPVVCVCAAWGAFGGRVVPTGGIHAFPIDATGGSRAGSSHGLPLLSMAFAASRSSKRLLISAVRRKPLAASIWASRPPEDP